jgi:hypothetical protein
MSGVPKAPAAPRLRAIREAWLRPVIGQLEADPGISAAGFVGSIGRGDADDWSDVDLVIVVPDDQVGRYADAARRAGPERVALSFDARRDVVGEVAGVGCARMTSMCGPRCRAYARQICAGEAADVRIRYGP